MKYTVEVKGELPKQGALQHAQRASVHGLLDDLAGEICDKICKWPETYGEDEAKLYNEHCKECPLEIL